MSFIIKDTNLKVSYRKIFEVEDEYLPFPSTGSVAFDENTLLPIGLLSYKIFDGEVNDQILIAVPNAQGIFDGDYPFITYSLTSEGWELDKDFLDASEYKFEDNYIKYYQQAKAFFKQHHHLTYCLKDGEKEPLFELGGQPPLGQNWDSVLYDEMEDNPELDRYHDIMEEESGSDYEYMSNREITYFDEDLEQEFIFLGRFSYDLYLDGGGDCIVFYQPGLKKVMVVAEFS